MAANGDFLCHLHQENQDRHFTNLEHLQQHIWFEHQEPAPEPNYTLRPVPQQRAHSRSSDSLSEFRVGDLYNLFHYKVTWQRVNYELRQRNLPQVVPQNAGYSRYGPRLFPNLFIESLVSGLILLTISNTGLPFRLLDKPWGLITQAYTKGLNLDCLSVRQSLPAHDRKIQEAILVENANRLTAEINQLKSNPPKAPPQLKGLPHIQTHKEPSMYHSRQELRFIQGSILLQVQGVGPLLVPLRINLTKVNLFHILPEEYHSSIATSLTTTEIEEEMEESLQHHVAKIILQFLYISYNNRPTTPGGLQETIHRILLDRDTFYLGPLIGSTRNRQQLDHDITYLNEPLWESYTHSRHSTKCLTFWPSRNALLDFPCLTRFSCYNFTTQDVLYVLEAIVCNYLLDSKSYLEAWGEGLKVHNKLRPGLVKPYDQTNLQSKCRLHAKGYFVCAGGCFALHKSSSMGISVNGLPQCQACPLQTEDTTQPHDTRESSASRIHRSVVKAMRKEMNLLGTLPQPHSPQIAALKRLQNNCTDTLVRQHWDTTEAALRDSLTGELLDQPRSVIPGSQYNARVFSSSVDARFRIARPSEPELGLVYHSSPENLHILSSSLNMIKGRFPPTTLVLLSLFRDAVWKSDPGAIQRIHRALRNITHLQVYYLPGPMMGGDVTRRAYWLREQGPEHADRMQEALRSGRIDLKADSPIPAFRLQLTFCKLSRGGGILRHIQTCDACQAQGFSCEDLVERAWKHPRYEERLWNLRSIARKYGFDEEYDSLWLREDAGKNLVFSPFDFSSSYLPWIRHHWTNRTCENQLRAHIRMNDDDCDEAFPKNDFRKLDEDQRVDEVMYIVQHIRMGRYRDHYNYLKKERRGREIRPSDLLAVDDAYFEIVPIPGHPFAPSLCRNDHSTGFETGFTEHPPTDPANQWDPTRCNMSWDTWTTNRAVGDLPQSKWGEVFEQLNKLTSSSDPTAAQVSRDGGRSWSLSPNANIFVHDMLNDCMEQWRVFADKLSPDERARHFERGKLWPTPPAGMFPPRMHGQGSRKKRKERKAEEEMQGVPDQDLFGRMGDMLSGNGLESDDEEIPLDGFPTEDDLAVIDELAREHAAKPKGLLGSRWAQDPIKYGQPNKRRKADAHTGNRKDGSAQGDLDTITAQMERATINPTVGQAYHPIWSDTNPPLHDQPPRRRRQANPELPFAYERGYLAHDGGSAEPWKGLIVKLVKIDRPRAPSGGDPNLPMGPVYGVLIHGTMTIVGILDPRYVPQDLDRYGDQGTVVSVARRDGQGNPAWEGSIRVGYIGAADMAGHMKMLEEASSRRK